MSQAGLESKPNDATPGKDASSAHVSGAVASGKVGQSPSSTGQSVSKPTLKLEVPSADQKNSGKRLEYLGRDVPLKISVQDDKTFWQDPTSILSTLAIVVSIASVVASVALANRQAAKARKQSIDDEFWLRNVLYPLSIQPALEFYSRASTELPLDRYDPTATSVAITSFKNAFDTGHSIVLSKLISLTVLSAPLHNTIQLEFEKIDDVVSTYCFANQSGYDSAAIGSNDMRVAVVNTIGLHLAAALLSVKKLQSEL